MAFMSRHEMALELEEAHRKFLDGDLMSHHECLIMYIRQEMSSRQFCERDICLTDRWYAFLRLKGRPKPGTEADADDFFYLIAEYIDDPTNTISFWTEDFDIQAAFEKYRGPQRKLE